jgi:hypothetical protein
MPSKTKHPRKTVKKSRKRGPKEERLVITEDPAVALSRLLNPPTPTKKTVN